MWSLFTMLTPFAAHTNLWALLIVRFLTGIGEGAVHIFPPAVSCLSLVMEAQGRASQPHCIAASYVL